MFWIIGVLSVIGLVAYKPTRNVISDIFHHSRAQVSHGLGTAKVKHEGRNRKRIFHVQTTDGKVVLPSFEKGATEEIYICEKINAPEGIVTEDDMDFEEVYNKGENLITFGLKCLAMYRRPKDFRGCSAVSILLCDYIEDVYYHVIVKEGEFIDYERYLMLLRDGE